MAQLQILYSEWLDYYTFNYKDHWDLGLLNMLHITLLDQLSGARHTHGCIS